MVQTSATKMPPSSLEPTLPLSLPPPLKVIRHWPRNTDSTYSKSFSQICDTRPTASLSVEIADLLRTLLHWNIRVVRADEVQNYLLQFPEMIEITREVAQIARERLSDAQLWIEVYHDPEIEDEYLSIDARFPSYDESVLERIEEVESEYLPLLQGKGGRHRPWGILLTTDFRNPE